MVGNEVTLQDIVLELEPQAIDLFCYEEELPTERIHLRRRSLTLSKYLTKSLHLAAAVGPDCAFVCLQQFLEFGPWKLCCWRK